MKMFSFLWYVIAIFSNKTFTPFGLRFPCLHLLVKKNGKIQAVIDIFDLNQHLIEPHFKMKAKTYTGIRDSFLSGKITVCNSLVMSA